MENYRLTKTDCVISIETGFTFPPDPGNAFYQRYLAWLAEGNEAEPYTEPPAPIPQSLTPRQTRLVLLQAGLLDQVNAGIAAMTGEAGVSARITWDFATEVRRDDPLLMQISASFGLTSEQVDQMFVAGSKL